MFILADDLGNNDLSIYGHPTIRTPHLDQMAREGALFTQAYSAAPICTPPPSLPAGSLYAMESTATSSMRETRGSVKTASVACLPLRRHWLSA